MSSERQCKTKGLWQIVCQVSPPTRWPFLILETVETMDGPRSRIASGRFATQQEAEEYMYAERK